MENRLVATEVDASEVKYSWSTTVNLRDGQSVGADEELEMAYCFLSGDPAAPSCAFAIVDATSITSKIL